MPISIDGAGTITGISAGGLPDACVTAADLASGAARSNFGAGCVLQVVQTPVTTVFQTASTAFVDVTGMTATLTPASINSKVLVVVDAKFGCGSNAIAKLVRNGSDIYVGDASGSATRVSFPDLYSPTVYSGGHMLCYLDSPNSATAVTYKIQAKTFSASYVLYFNGSYGNANTQSYHIRSASSITLVEIAG
jgi:hypothetical protein